MIRCELCNSTDMVRATVKESKTVIAICRECESVYETDEKLNPVFGHDSEDIQYFEKLEKLFKNWNNVTNIVSYKSLEIK